MKADWWDDPLTLQDLAEAISIPRRKISYSLIKHQHLYTSLRLRIPCTCSPPTPHIHSTFNQIRIWNPPGDLRWSFFAETVYCLRRRFSPLGLYRWVLNSSYVLIFLIHTKHKYKNMKSWTEPTYSFRWRRTHELGRQDKKRVTNSWAAAHKSWMVKYFPRAPEFSRSNKHEDSHKESPWFPHSNPDSPHFLNSLHSHPYSLHSHPNLFHSYLDSPCSHPDYLRSHPDS